MATTKRVSRQNGTEVEDRIYNRSDFDEHWLLMSEQNLEAKKVSEFLKGTDRFSKTIIFCVDIDHAERMRHAMTKENADLVRATINTLFK